MNKAERDKIAEAGDYLEAIYEGITDSEVGGKNNTIWRLGKLRRMKFIYEDKEYAYGFALTPKEFNEIKSLVLDQRK